MNVCEKWMQVDIIFGGDGKRFEKESLLTEVYEEAVAGHSPDKIKAVLKSFLEEDEKKMPTAKQIRSALNGTPTESRDRASESVSRIWGLIGSLGSYDATGAKQRLNDEEWEAVRLYGGWQAVCDVTYAKETQWKAQMRDLLNSIYNRTSHGHAPRLPDADDETPHQIDIPQSKEVAIYES